MIRKTYASIEKKLHPDVDKSDFSYKDLKAEITHRDKEIINEILDFINIYQFELLDGTGEWEWLQNNKQSQYINGLKNKDYNLLCELFTNMFRNEVTYGYVSPSFSDLNNQKIKKESSSDILCNIDTCFEFTNIQNLEQLVTNVKCGMPFGKKFNKGYILPDTPRHFYYATKIFNLESLSNTPSILEIGGGYGGLCKELWEIYQKKCTLINIDLLPGLLSAYYFLKTCNIPVKFIFDENDISQNFVNLVPVKLLNKINSKKNMLDLIFNSRSLCEMDKNSNNEYINFINNSNASYFYHENSNFLLFPDSERHVEILSDEFMVDKNKYNLLQASITPFSGGDGRYREYIYKKIQ